MNVSYLGAHSAESADTAYFYIHIDEKEAYIKHYQTKTLGEFINQKFNRTDLDYHRSANSLNYYFRQNSLNKEKINFVYEKTGINILNDPSYDFFDFYYNNPGEYIKYILNKYIYVLFIIFVILKNKNIRK